MNNTKDIGPVMRQIGNLLNQHEEEVQGAMIANLLAQWAEKFRYEDDGSSPDEMRRLALGRIFKLTIQMVRAVDELQQAYAERKLQ